MRRVFPANQARNTSQLIGYGFFRRVHFVAVGINPPAIVVNHFHSGDADCYFTQAFAPWPSKAVGNDHGNVQSRPLLQLR